MQVYKEVSPEMSAAKKGKKMKKVYEKCSIKKAKGGEKKVELVICELEEK